MDLAQMGRPCLIYIYGQIRQYGLFVPKPSTNADCQRRSIPGLGQTVRACPLASTAVRGDYHSLCHSAVREPVVSGCCSHTLSKSAGRRPAMSATVRDLGRPFRVVRAERLRT